MIGHAVTSYGLAVACAVDGNMGQAVDHLDELTSHEMSQLSMVLVDLADCLREKAKEVP